MMYSPLLMPRRIQAFNRRFSRDVPLTQCSLHHNAQGDDDCYFLLLKSASQREHTLLVREKPRMPPPYHAVLMRPYAAATPGLASAARARHRPRKRLRASASAHRPAARAARMPPRGRFTRGATPPPYRRWHGRPPAGTVSSARRARAARSRQMICFAASHAAPAAHLAGLH